MLPQPPLPGPVASYGLLLVVGSIAAWWWTRRRASAAGVHASHADLLVPCALLAGVVGSALLPRLLPAAWLATGAGTSGAARLELLGVLAASLPVVLLHAHLARLPRRALLDVLALPALLWVVSLRLGCFLAGCCWGEVPASGGGSAGPSGVMTERILGVGALDSWLGHFALSFPAGSLAWEQHVAAGLLPATAPRSLPVHPTQLYEAAVALALLLALHVLEDRLRAPGLVAAAALGGLAASRVVIESLRADHAAVAGAWTLNQLAWGALAPACLVAAWLFRRARTGGR